MIRVLWLLVLLISQVAHAEVSVSEGWVRLLPPVVKTTAAYMTVVSSEQDTLLSVSSPQVERVEIHLSSMTDGMMSMDQVDNIELQAGKALQLSPGGYHLMLIGLKNSLKEGEIYQLQLNFAKAGAVDISIPVKR